MKRFDREYLSLYAFNLFYFGMLGASTFLSKYYAQLGMSNLQIGVMSSVPAVVALLFQPFWGVVTDRARHKKSVMIAACAALGVLLLFANRVPPLLPLLLVMISYNILQAPVTPGVNTIGLEYALRAGRAYGPIRLSGTVGYQIGLLLVGVVCPLSLTGLYPMMGGILIASAVIACFLPGVEGHQKKEKRLSPLLLFRDRRIAILIAMVLVSNVPAQFHASFFAKHLADMGVDNRITSYINVLSVMLELPFLVFADRLYKRLSVWYWMVIGFALCAVRWIGLSFAASVPALILFQLPAVAILACFNFFPSMYLALHAPDELKGSAQICLIATFSVGNVLGGLLGGFIANHTGIPALFLANGVALALAAALFLPVARRLSRAD